MLKQIKIILYLLLFILFFGSMGSSIIDEVFSRSDLGLEIEEVKINKDSNLIGKSFEESRIRNNFNAIIVGI
jgi:K+/H+ antiporter YhaU regulatory subunit KhtT